MDVFLVIIAFNIMVWFIQIAYVIGNLMDKKIKTKEKFLLNLIPYIWVIHIAKAVMELE